MSNNMFSFFYNGKLIGLSELEEGDAPMGIASGLFFPTKAFDEIRPIAETIDAGKSKHSLETRIWEGLQVTTPVGEAIQCHAVSVLEYGSIEAPERLEADCVYIPYPLYEQLFPHHVASYKAQFADD